ncbi:MAG: tRNA (guanosine(46)-N7)-methyltransferase TrmB [Acidobacteria bacterium]|nr:tRNA (guanosine(46)-N7)-methyltransferase TrmB [Acidobacteriota bacterium]
MNSELILPKEQRQACEIVPADCPKPLDFSVLYGYANPVELEIGIGKGYFMMTSALADPETNFLGIEYARKYLIRAIDRIEKRPIRNVRLVHTEAMTFIQEHIPDQSLRTVHLYFPDPWHKKRHHKRRIFQLNFIEQVHRILQPKGHLLIATDHADYWAWMQEVLEKQTLLNPSERLPEPPIDTEGLTNYEIKYLREGRTIYRTGYQKP